MLCWRRLQLEAPWSVMLCDTANVIFVVLLVQVIGGDEDTSAPCGNHLVHKRQVMNHCHYPCKCPIHDIQCKAGVSIIKDGCDCCYMCARQQGDLCNYKDKCDHEKGLFCDFHVISSDLGVCRAKAAKPCEVNGITYKDGEEFKPSCNRLCSCQNGNYACTSLCPQEEHKPSIIHCKEPRLLAIKGRCCKEWVCPNSNSLPDAEDETPSPQPGGCEPAWTPCSVTCGMGVSNRLVYRKDRCEPAKSNEDCPKSWRHKLSGRLEYNGCTSVKDFRPKFCSMCKHRCCVPDKAKTNPMEWDCDGKIVVHDFMWIKSCVCTDECP